MNDENRAVSKRLISRNTKIQKQAIWGHRIMASTKNEQFCDPPNPSILKNKQ